MERQFHETLNEIIQQIEGADSAKQLTTDPTDDTLILDRFLLHSEIGKGTFGTIFRTYDLMQKQLVCTKVEEVQEDVKVPQLRTDFQVLMAVHQLDKSRMSLIEEKNYNGSKLIAQQEIKGFPYFHGFGKTTRFHYLVMELLGENLNQVKLPERTFSLETVVQIGLQALERVEYLHSVKYLHRDLKPENFVLGREKQSDTIFLVDFGLSKRFIDYKTNDHIPFNSNVGVIGTSRYMSLNAHRGHTLSRRDDIESLGYLLVYLIRDHLPWQVASKDPNKLEKVQKIKEQLSLEELCYELPGFPLNRPNIQIHRLF